MQLSSARASAPQRLTRPNPIQRARMETGSPTSLARVKGFRKTPLPIVMPTISAKPPQKPMTRSRSLAGGVWFVESSDSRVGPLAARADAIEYATMALLFQTSSRAVHILLFAALGAGAATSMVQDQSAAPAKAASALVPDPDDGGITLPEGFRALVVADALHTKDPDTTGAIRFLAVA